MKLCVTNEPVTDGGPSPLRRARTATSGPPWRDRRRCQDRAGRTAPCAPAGRATPDTRGRCGRTSNRGANATASTGPRGMSNAKTRRSFSGGGSAPFGAFRSCSSASVAQSDPEALERRRHEGVGLRLPRDVEPVVGEAEGRDVVVPRSRQERPAVCGAPRACFLDVERREAIAEELQVCTHVDFRRHHAEVLPLGAVSSAMIPRSGSGAFGPG